MFDKPKREPRLNSADYDPISMGEFTEAACRVLLKPTKPPPSENREPTKKELERRYKLV